MKRCCCALFLLLCLWVRGGDEPLSIVAVGEAEITRDTLTLAPVEKLRNLRASDLNFARDYHKQLVDNFTFYKKFFQIFTSSQKLSLYQVFSHLSRVGRTLGLRVSVQKGGEVIFSRSFIVPPLMTARRRLTHQVSEDIYRSITNRDSIFTSKIFFVSDRHSIKGKVIKELYMMDFDGGNKKRLTNHKSIVFSPSVGSKGELVLYSVMRTVERKKRVHLRLLNLRTGVGRLLSSAPGLNSGAVFSPSGDSYYLTMSYQGNAEIYKVNLRTGQTLRLTRHRSEDVDPSINALGETMTFLSGRPGKPMIYTAQTDGVEKRVKRVSFTGKFNATPRFSPNGSEIVFASWQDNSFDLYRIGSDGKGLVRLTRDFGSNESPSYSRDGGFIVFSSQRVLSRKKALQDLYIMDREGEIFEAVTANFGKCTSPRWSR